MPKPTQHKNLKIVLIEDDPAIVAMYKLKFESAGHSIDIANNGQDGLALVARVKPDIILLDMMMPQMSGVETLTRLRATPVGKTFKVIALTNMKDHDTVEKINQLGVTDYLVKAEISPTELEKKVVELASSQR